jgi:hypothetical protein
VLGLRFLGAAATITAGIPEKRCLRASDTIVQYHSAYCSPLMNERRSARVGSSRTSIVFGRKQGVEGLVLRGDLARETCSRVRHSSVKGLGKLKT